MKVKALFVVLFVASILAACGEPARQPLSTEMPATKTPIMEVQGFKMGRPEAQTLLNGGNPDDIQTIASVLPSLWTLRNFVNAVPQVDVYLNQIQQTLAIVVPETSLGGNVYYTIAFIRTDSPALIETAQGLRSIGYDASATIKAVMTETEIKGVIEALESTGYTEPADKFAVNSPAAIASLKLALDYIGSRVISAGEVVAGYTGGTIIQILAAPIDTLNKKLYDTCEPIQN